MKNILLFLIVTCLFLFSCVESKEDKSSRQDLGIQVRQINTSFKNLKDNQKAENEITRLTLSNYYNGYTTSLSDIRSKLASIILTQKYYDLRKSLETLISKSLEILNMRRDLTNEAFSISENISDFKRNVENTMDYKYDSYGYKYYLKYKKEALTNSIEFILNKAKYSYDLIKYDSTINALIGYSIITNKRLNEFNFADTLDFYNSLYDTTDLAHSINTNLKKIDLNTDNL